MINEITQKKLKMQIPKSIAKRAAHAAMQNEYQIVYCNNNDNHRRLRCYNNEPKCDNNDD